MNRAWASIQEKDRMIRYEEIEMCLNNGLLHANRTRTFSMEEEKKFTLNSCTKIS